MAAFNNPIDRKPRIDPTQAASAKLQEAVKKNDIGQVKAAMQEVSDAYTKEYGHRSSINQFQQYVSDVVGKAPTPEVKTAMQDLVASAESMDTGADSTVWGSDMSGASWSKGTVNLYPSGTPSPNDVNQKGIGSCAVDAALAGWAAQNPGEIQSHITPLGEGGKDGFSVRMVSPDNKDINVEVDGDIFKDKNGNTLSVSSANGDANWATVMEKALAKYKDIYGEGPIGGERSDDAIYAFRGNKGSVGFDAGQTTVADAESQTAKANRSVVTGGFDEELTLPSGEKAITGHAYTVMGVVQDAQGNKFVEMRNPWGATPKADDTMDTSQSGVLRVPADVFEKHCDMRVIYMD